MPERSIFVSIFCVHFVSIFCVHFWGSIGSLYTTPVVNVRFKRQGIIKDKTQVAYFDMLTEGRLESNGDEIKDKLAL